MAEFTGIVSQGPLIRIRLTPIYPGAQHIFGFGVIDTGASITSIDVHAAMCWRFRQLGYRRINSASQRAVPTPIFDVNMELMGQKGTYKRSLHALGFRGGGSPAALEDMNRIIALIGRDVLNRGVLVYDGPKNNFLLQLS